MSFRTLALLSNVSPPASDVVADPATPLEEPDAAGVTSVPLAMMSPPVDWAARLVSEVAGKDVVSGKGIPVGVPDSRVESVSVNGKADVEVRKDVESDSKLGFMDVAAVSAVAEVHESMSPVD